jgi:hypothetical protein
VPAWILKLNLWEMVGVIAYTQAFALFETIILVLLFVIAAFILPGRLLRDNLKVSSALIMLVFACWMLVLHYRFRWIENENHQRLALWGLSFILAVAAAIWVSNKWERLRSPVGQITSRLSVLVGLYLFIDFISILIIVIRNINF